MPYFFTLFIMGATDRIKEYLSYKGISKYAFYKQTGFSNKFLDNSSNMGTDRAEIILRQFPDINPEWLITGEGPMNKEPKDSDVVLEKDFRLTGEKTRDAQYIPLFELEAAAGFVSLFNDSLHKPYDYIMIPDLPPCDGAVHVRGDSMYPLLKSGDIVLYKQVTDLEYGIFWGEVYLISFELDGEEYVMVKYIQKSEIKDHIKLVSYNQHHSPQDIPRNKVRGLALVKASVRYNTMK